MSAAPGYTCCKHCVDDPEYREEYGSNTHEISCSICDHDEAVAKVSAGLLNSAREAAYDEGFAQAEEEHDGFVGASGWANRNPYRSEK